MTHERIVLKKSNTDQQICLWCGEKMGKGEMAISLKNHPGSTLTLRKNLWVHTKCRAGLAAYLMYDFKDLL